MISIFSLFVVDTFDAILKVGLDVAKVVGLPVSSWRTGDPTRSAYTYLATVLAKHSEANAEFIKGGFKSTAGEEWGEVLASEVYGVTRGEDTFSTPTVTVHNTGGGVYTIDPGDFTVKATSTGITFHNTGVNGVDGASVTLNPGDSATFLLVCDVAGSDGTVTANEIDSIVTTRLGVVITSSTASVGNDKQPLDSLKQDCDDTLGAISADGPPDAYEYVARHTDTVNGGTTLLAEGNNLRARSTNDSATNDVTIYICDGSGTADGPTIAKVQACEEKWATPLCTTPTVVSASAVTVPITATIYGSNIPGDAVARLTDALQTYFASLPIADETGGMVYVSPLTALVHKTVPEVTHVVWTLPASDTAYTEGQVPVLGTVSITEA